MPFRAHNAYYLRISSNDVIPLYLYLDDKHVEWMSDRTLQHVLEDLRPLVLQKLKAEVNLHGADAKQRTVEVHRGETYQFAFFFRNAEPHSVLIKPFQKKAESMLPPQDISAGNSPVKKKTRKRTKETVGIPRSSREQQKGKGKGKARRDDPEGEDNITSFSDDSDDDVQEVVQTPIVPRRSGRSRKLVAGGYQGPDNDVGEDSDSFGNADIEMSPPHDASPESSNLPTPELAPDGTDPLALIPDREANTIIVKDEEEEPTLGYREGIAPQQQGLPEIESEIHMHDPPPAQPPSANDDIEIEIEEEEEKPKPLLRLRYQGFSIHGHCLCVIVEPYPPVQSSSRAPSLAPLSGTSISRASSIAPLTFVTSGEAGRRAKTPLFLPEVEYDRSDTPVFARQRTLPPVPLFNDPPFEGDNVIDEDNESGLMAFSQIMSAGVHRFGAIDDDDEIDGAVFFGDADESREL